MKNYIESDYTNAHKFSINNGEMLKKDKKCGCFYCLSIYSPTEINEWIHDKELTALCPYCGVDSVLGESSGYPITKEFLSEMNERWFGGMKK